MRVPYRTASASYPVIAHSSLSAVSARLSGNQAAGKTPPGVSKVALLTPGDRKVALLSPASPRLASPRRWLPGSAFGLQPGPGAATGRAGPPRPWVGGPAGR